MTQSLTKLQAPWDYILCLTTPFMSILKNVLHK